MLWQFKLIIFILPCANFISSRSILTNNVRGLGDQNKRRELFYWLKLHNISIACLQETFITKDKLCKISQEWEGFSFNSISDSNHS